MLVDIIVAAALTVQRGDQRYKLNYIRMIISYVCNLICTIMIQIVYNANRHLDGVLCPSLGGFNVTQ